MKESAQDDKYRIDSVKAIRGLRMSANGKIVPGYEKLLSDSLEDWYSDRDSKDFNKETLVFSGMKAVIEGTEFGDVLMTAAAAIRQVNEAMELHSVVVQGFETPHEDSDLVVTSCGQSSCIPFTMGRTDRITKDDVPKGSDGGVPYDTLDFEFTQIWSYRRVATTWGLSREHKITVFPLEGNPIRTGVLAMIIPQATYSSIQRRV